MVSCPKCGLRLRKDDVVIRREYDALSGNIVLVQALCPNCGHVLAKKERTATATDVLLLDP